ncbi:MAG: hypothetical protein QXZ31_11310 [Thermofilaceae archaeon]
MRRAEDCALGAPRRFGGRFAVRRRRGQLALIGVIVLAATLIALVSLRTPNPYVAYERGHLQAAQLLHLARACFSESCSCQRLQSLLTILVNVNRSEPLRMYPTFSPCTVDNPLNRTVRSGQGWVTEYQVKFALATPVGVEYVAYYARVEGLGEEGTYTKTVVVSGSLKTLTMVKVRLRYGNSYTTPFFNASLCPRLADPQGYADFLSFDPSSCEWLVAVPKDFSAAIPPPPGPPPAPAAFYVYKLRDEWGVIVPVYHRGG